MQVAGINFRDSQQLTGPRVRALSRSTEDDAAGDLRVLSTDRDDDGAVACARVGIGAAPAQDRIYLVSSKKRSKRSPSGLT